MSSASEVRSRVIVASRHYAEQEGLAPYVYFSATGVPLFPPYTDENGVPRHGNFHREVYGAIRARPAWCSRLAKAHPRRAGLPAPYSSTARELDSATSSDALLMNVFCHPEAPSLFGTDFIFGFAARVPIGDQRADMTEIDLATDAWVVEAKLTEADFTSKRRPVVEGYRDFHRIFDTGRLLSGEEYTHYQLIRNVLAAYATGRRSAVIVDRNRTDLQDAWRAVMDAVNDAELRQRCSLLTWQDLSSMCSLEMRAFLRTKYGIAA